MGFIFDMDGTMVDNMVVHNLAWQKTLSDAGRVFTFEEVKATCVGKNEDIIFRIFGDTLDVYKRKKLAASKEEAYRIIFKDQLKLVDGLSEFLADAHLQGIPMGIATAAPAENVNFVLDNMPIRHFFKVILCDKDVENGKPHPEVFLKAASLMGIAPEQCLAFEDSPTGAEATLRAGMKAVLLTTTHDAEEFKKFPHIVALVKDFTSLTPEKALNYIKITEKIN